MGTFKFIFSNKLHIVHYIKAGVRTFQITKIWRKPIEESDIKYTNHFITFTQKQKVLTFIILVYTLDSITIDMWFFQANVVKIMFRVF